MGKANGAKVGLKLTLAAAVLLSETGSLMFRLWIIHHFYYCYVKMLVKYESLHAHIFSLIRHFVFTGVHGFCDAIHQYEKDKECTVIRWR